MLYSHSIESEHNIKVFHTVVTELKLEYGGDDKCPWTMLQLKGMHLALINNRVMATDNLQLEGGLHIYMVRS